MWAIRSRSLGTLRSSRSPSRLRTRANSCCRSDESESVAPICTFTTVYNPFARYPRVIGHEVLGTVAALGADVEGFATGDRVALDPVVSCGLCHACRIGRPNVCRRLQVIGVHRDGGMSEFCVIPAANAVKVPDKLSDRAAVMAEPYSIAANIMLRSEADANDIASDLWRRGDRPGQSAGRQHEGRPLHRRRH